MTGTVARDVVKDPVGTVTGTVDDVPTRWARSPGPSATADTVQLLGAHGGHRLGLDPVGSSGWGSTGLGLRSADSGSVERDGSGGLLGGLLGP